MFALVQALTCIILLRLSGYDGSIPVALEPFFAKPFWPLEEHHSAIILAVLSDAKPNTLFFCLYTPSLQISFHYP